ncbi:hypothetical protein STPYR_11869 [uncultured Stenotrophomonas sp.]|uniref:Uncharacterized protein n=1 Tax=uncultured Stenotrophomonas sp. TaxID=165438 RepID=A0A1Y5Q3T5_9GAMM|nr:hypothetical protein STPYR_11869 [uncultured Stenotrophomonas sp.]
MCERHAKSGAKPAPPGAYCEGNERRMRAIPIMGAAWPGCNVAGMAGLLSLRGARGCLRTSGSPPRGGLAPAQGAGSETRTG